MHCGKSCWTLITYFPSALRTSPATRYLNFSPNQKNLSACSLPCKTRNAIHALHDATCQSIHDTKWCYSQQGLEKYNDLVTKDYFRSSSHRGQECLVQILQKQNRIEDLENSGAKRKKRFEVTCSVCGSKGHNKTSCSKKVS